LIKVVNHTHILKSIIIAVEAILRNGKAEELGGFESEEELEILRNFLGKCVSIVNNSVQSFESDINQNPNSDITSTRISNNINSTIS